MTGLLEEANAYQDFLLYKAIQDAIRDRGDRERGGEEPRA
jgi:hypothetical protein